MISIEIKNSGSAFDEPHQEVARILRELANSIEQGVERTTLYDINGNRCGSVSGNFEQD
jgi:hypothetical protein